MKNEKGPGTVNAKAPCSLTETVQYELSISRRVNFSLQIQPRDRSPRHPRAVVRYVEALGGPARYLCRECLRQVCATEARSVNVAQWNSLFNVSPRLILAGDVIRALADRLVNYLLALAMLAAFRDRNHKPFIALARLVARFAERRRAA